MPYIEEMVSIGKAENGYVLTVRVPYKEDDDFKSNREKVILFKDTTELAEKLETLLPSLKDKMSSDEEFDNAFAEVVESESF